MTPQANLFFSVYSGSFQIDLGADWCATYHNKMLNLHHLWPDLRWSAGQKPQGWPGGRFINFCYGPVTKNYYLMLGGSHRDSIPYNEFIRVISGEKKHLTFISW